MDAIAVTIALNVVLEFAATAVNLFCLQTELVELAADLDMLDLKRLHDINRIPGIVSNKIFQRILRNTHQQYIIIGNYRINAWLKCA